MLPFLTEHHGDPGRLHAEGRTTRVALEDAREQVKRGLDRAEQDFGQRPVGMWPSEGSVSPEVLEILGKCGVRWCATDQGNLERSELESRPAGPLHVAPWKCGEVSMFFRDRESSDAIGFRYGKSDKTGADAKRSGPIRGRHNHD